MTDESRALPLDNETPPVRKLKRGDVREDGMVFWSYDPRRSSGEYWISEEKSATKRAKINARERVRQKERRADHEYRVRDNAKKNAYRKGADATIRRNAKRRARYAKDPLYVLSGRVRRRTRRALKQKKFSKTSAAEDLIGCTYEELKAHIESLFTEGMNWDNRSEWHVDHIEPLASATTEEELLKLCHYTNLQPLWAKDNLSKGAKIL